MKKHASKILIGLIVGMFAGGAVLAQSTPLKVNVPFQFSVGDTQLHAGEYIVRLIANGSVLQLQNTEARDAMVVMIITAKVRESSGRGKLVFNRYGSEYFLSQVAWPDFDSGVELLKSKRESQLAKLAVSRPISIPVPTPLKSASDPDESAPEK